MGTAKKPQKRKLIIGFIYSHESNLKRAENLLVRKFGDIDCRSPELQFTYTPYYENEMGVGLKRRFVSFKRLCGLENVWKIKCYTNIMETRFLKDNKRTVNIDPGYISLPKLVLLTTKDYSHRLYLGGGIFGEVTLIFKGGAFTPQWYTYPDYRTKQYVDFFNDVRIMYKSQI